MARKEHKSESIKLLLNNFLVLQKKHYLCSNELHIQIEKRKGEHHGKQKRTEEKDKLYLQRSLR